MDARGFLRHARALARLRGAGRAAPLVLAVVTFVLGACSAATPSLTPATPPVSASATPESHSALPAAVTPPSATATVLTVYFTDRHRYEAAVEPYEVPVERRVAADGAEPRAVLDAFFAGPTEDERAKGLMAVTSGFTGVRAIHIAAGVAHVFLDGRCASGGATYTIAGAIRANLLPFADIAWVKIYDQAGETENPGGQSDSIPLCLEP